MFNVNRLVLSIGIWAGISACSVTENSIQQKRDVSVKPNVIFILVDDMGYGELGSFGQTIINTPNLDQMANEGMKLSNFYAGSAVCAPSRASLMTGQHTGHSQIRGNYDMGGNFEDETEYGQLPLKAGTTTLATLMKDAGYVTGAVGKWGLGGPGSQGEPNKQGFDYFFGYLDQKQAHNHTPTHLWRNTEWVKLDNEPIKLHNLMLENFDYDNPLSYEQFTGGDFAQEHLNAAALDFIDSNKNKPFFLYLSYAMPHAALQAPDEEIEKYYFEVDPPNKGSYYNPTFKPRATRAAMVTYTDKHIGKVMTKLKEQGLDDNTLVIFTSDNGAAQEGGVDLELFNANGSFRGQKRQLYEGGIRMPTIAWWPGRIEPSTESKHIGAFWDVMPTLAELAGQPIVEKIDGISFLPTLIGGKQVEHDYLYWEFPHGKKSAQAIRDGKWKALRLFKGDRVKGYKEIVELYNLSVDDAESNNLAKQYPELMKKYTTLMDKSRSRSEIDKWNFD
ncbi:arylsulfatase [Psychrosphaera sp. B3R10]|uniref:arylsulfatase n=1 Tax=unclassified Psychrosphaera TaxID=2641570 RepID=UPI001C093B66|nr:MULTISPECIES: arylsulfatase [unclassified Psychrosphaera]MBU2881733.1 arylsulfatase [Psychrosphaera sp. I2R16]MBU2990082.1 arylsulfatase [Psychrosphaera sp. B3R10]